MYKLDYWIDTAKPKTNAKYEGGIWWFRDLL
jgi:hypothetical protein